MPIDPICGMKVSEDGLNAEFNGERYYFCSMRCMDKFRKENGIEVNCVSCEHASKGKPFWRDPLLIISVVIVIAIFLGYIFPFFEPLKKNIFEYIRILLFPVILGLLIGGLIDWFIPRSYISKLLAAGTRRTILYSVMTGFLMSACSHGILALAIQLYKKGASVPAVVAFLLASPWANLPLTILIIGFFGLKGLIFVISAIVIAITSGYIFMFLDKKGLIERNTSTLTLEKDFSIVGDIKERIKSTRFDRSFFKKSIEGIFSGSVSLANMVLWWILVGVFISGIVATYVPTEWMEAYMGASIVGLLITLAFATVIEICSEGSAPLAFEIFQKTSALGNSFVFLMAGVATDYTEIGLIWTNIGKKSAIWLPIVAVPQVVLLGILYNYLF